jgi:pimeloyl-ACP methyl ester carboxylesterase
MKQFRLTVLIGLCYTLAFPQTLPPGPQILTFFSDVDDSEQPYCIYVPPDFDETRNYPLVVMLHGAGSNHRLAMRRVFGNSNFPGENDVEASLHFPPWKDVGMIVAAPYTRGTGGYQGIMEKDVLDMVSDIRRRFPVDTNRMYLTGLSMGGGGALWIGLGHPDLWAAIAAVCPSTPEGTKSFAPNALNSAVRFVHGTEDPVVPVSVSREWVAELRRLQSPVVEYQELPGVDHWSWVQAYEGGRIFEWFGQYTRNPFPLRVRHASPDLSHGRAYWVQMDQKTPGFVSRITAAFTDTNTISVTTTDLSAFTLSIGGHPYLRPGSPLRLTIDGHAMERPATLNEEYSFSISDAGWTAAMPDVSLHKQTDLEGPLASVLTRRHVYVYGTADNPNEKILQARIETALKAAEWSVYRGEFMGRLRVFPRVIADRDIRQSDYESANLVLFGTSATNSVIAGYADNLPLHLKEKAARKYGLVYLFPNDYGHLVLVNSGLPWWHVDTGADWRYLPFVQSALGKLQDYVLFSRDRKTLIQGYFDEHWQLSEEQMDELTKGDVVGLVKPDKAIK